MQILSIKRYSQRRMKVHKEGTGLLLTLFTILFIVNITLYHTVGKGMLFYSVAFVSTVLFLLVLNFFRSPFRRFPYDSEGLVIAPADGTIVAIEEVMENEILHKKCLQISIFMSIFNVHANWFPVNGTVKHVSHQNGRFMAAYLPKRRTNVRRSLSPRGTGWMSWLVRLPGRWHAASLRMPSRERNVMWTSKWGLLNSVLAWMSTCR